MLQQRQTVPDILKEDMRQLLESVRPSEGSPLKGE